MTDEKLLRFLKTPRTARQVAERFAISKPTAYAKIKMMHKTGKIVADRAPAVHGAKGPAPAGWRAL